MGALFKNSIPIIIGVTGHMDLLEDDLANDLENQDRCQKVRYIDKETKEDENKNNKIDKDKLSLREVVRCYLKKLIQNNPNTDFLIMSGFAKGADMLVVEEALKLKDKDGAKIGIMAVLPYEEEEYLKKSFKDDEEAKGKFKELIKKAEYKITLKPKEGEGKYVALADYLVKHSNILLALWDGDTSNIKPGGTAYVVEKKRVGYKAKNFLDTNEEDIIIHIRTPRKNNREIDNAYAVEKIFIGRLGESGFKSILKHIDSLNVKLRTKFKDEKEFVGLKRIREEFFRKSANSYQEKYKSYSIIMMALAFLGVLFVEIVHDFGAGHHTLEVISMLSYFLIIAVMFGLYYGYLRKANLKDNFVHSRGISEALRVQIAWFHMQKEPRRVGDFYLLDEISELVWIRAVLKNLYFLELLNPTIKREKSQKERLEVVKKIWIKSQLDYFSNAIKKREKSFKRFKALEKGFYTLGAISTILLFIFYIAGGLKAPEHITFFLSGISFAAAAFIGEKYLPFEGFKEELHNYQLMKYNFESSKDLLNRFKDERELLFVIYDLGEKALRENSRWVVYHSKYKIKPIVE